MINIRFKQLMGMMAALIALSLLLGATKVEANEIGKKVKVASLSFVPEKWNKEANLKKMDTLARQAAENGAKILVTPEGALEGYLIDFLRRSGNDRPKWEPKFQEIAEPVDGPGVTKIRDLAKELNVDFVLGFLERDGDYLHNTCVWIDAKGEILHRHRKTHMAQPYFDPPNYRPGYELKSFDTAYGRAGIIICYERQVPETSVALALDGAHIIINPSYGSRGEWNDTMLRTRARDNNCYFLFTHPKQTLAIAPNGSIILNEKDKEGIFYFEMGGHEIRQENLKRRRPEAFAKTLAQHVHRGNQRLSTPGRIKVAAVQLAVSNDLEKNTKRICEHIAGLAKQGVRVALFPECATTGYFKDEIPKYTEKQLKKAEETIAYTCAENDLYAIVGSPYFEDGVRYNMALVIDHEGRSIYRQAKIQLVGGDKGWAEPGNKLSTFKIDDITCSIIICHDSRYPELVRLPVLKGSRLVFYLSWESDMKAEHKIEPYRAQVVARAVENGIYVVHANAPQVVTPWMGSHGQSRIVSPRGVLLQEAPIFEETVLIEELDMNQARAGNARNSLRAKFLKDFWQAGMEKIDEVE